ncbi:hypothetical protein Tsp_04217 [Trichinella spiralis]|nr:hypothetical protein Tsp_04217 [Trichinella spiralis]
METLSLIMGSFSIYTCKSTSLLPRNAITPTWFT